MPVSVAVFGGCYKKRLNNAGRYCVVRDRATVNAAGLTKLLMPIDQPFIFLNVIYLFVHCLGGGGGHTMRIGR